MEDIWRSMDRDGDNTVTFKEFSDFIDDCQAEGRERRVLKSRMLREQDLNEETINRVEDGLISNNIKYGTVIQLLHVTTRDHRYHRRKEKHQPFRLKAQEKRRKEHMNSKVKTSFPSPTAV